MAISVCIVEDDNIILEMFSEIINGSDACRLVMAFDTAEAFMKEVHRLLPDVVIMDIQLPGRNGIECTRELKMKYPEMQFLMCSVLDDNDNIFDALCAGATGYLLKNIDANKLIQSIIEIYNGESPMSGVIARKVLRSFQNSKSPEMQLSLLSEREREILHYLSRGYRYKEIASRINISIETVRTHIRNIYDKLQVSSRTDALNKVFGK